MSTISKNHQDLMTPQKVRVYRPPQPDMSMLPNTRIVNNLAVKNAVNPPITAQTLNQLKRRYI